MTVRRLVANVLVGVVLAAILIGLAFIAIDERCTKNVVNAAPAERYQQVDFEPGISGRRR